MDILIIEDQKEKLSSIKSVISEELTSIPHELKIVNNLVDSRRAILENRYDLIIFDCFLPTNFNSPEIIDVSEDLILEFTGSKNSNSESIALTHIKLSQISNILDFNEAGITVVEFTENNNWINCLKGKLYKIKQKINYDFLIFCALAKERSAFNKTEAILGDLKEIKGLNAQSISIGKSKGLILVPSKMGLVEMAILTSKSIEFFNPKIVCMSGICAGFPKESNPLDIIVGSLCWEHQAGKIKESEVQNEAYQIQASSELTSYLKQSTEDTQLLEYVKSGLYQTELKDSSIKYAPITSGSAVIANKDKMNGIGEQHRKAAGLEMEMYAMYAAAEQSLCKPLWVGAKAVVDMGDTTKSDDLQPTGCTISARYIYKLLENKLSEI